MSEDFAVTRYETINEKPQRMRVTQIRFQMKALIKL